MFNPAPNPGHRVQPLNMGYVPDGFTEAQYKAAKAKESQKAAAKKNFWGKKSANVETLTEWQKKRDSKFGNQPGAGHTYVKLKGAALESTKKPMATKVSLKVAKAPAPKKFGGLFKR